VSRASVPRCPSTCRSRVAAGACPEPQISKSSQTKTSGTVLVVDDEVDLLEIAVVYLEDMGFKVFHATDGPRELQIAARQPDITLLVTTSHLPGE